MGSHLFVTGLRLLWDGEPYEIVRVLRDRSYTIEHEESGLRRTATHDELAAAIAADALKVVIEEREEESEGDGEGKDGARKRPRPLPDIALNDYPERLVEIGRFRLAAIRPLLEIELGGRTREAVQARSDELRAEVEPGREGTMAVAVSRTSLYQWIRDYERAGCDVRALIPDTTHRGGRDNSRLPKALVTLLDNTIKDLRDKPEKSSLDDLHREAALRVSEENKALSDDDQLSPPHRSTVARRVRALDVEGWFAKRNRGTRADRHRAGVQIQTRDERDLQPLDRVEIDETVTDLVVVDERDDLPLGRLNLMLAWDKATRYPLGYSLSFERGYQAVMSCLHHAMMPKTGTRERYGLDHEWLAHGVPRTLYIDNGRVFIGQDLDDACDQLDIELVRLPGRSPWYKGGIERQFGSLNTMLWHQASGTTFSGPQERGTYDSVAKACVSVQEVDRMLNRHLIDFYAERKHSGLNAIPARAWERAVAAGLPIRVPGSAQELRLLLSRVDTRVVEPYGIRMHSLIYNDDRGTGALAGLRRSVGKNPVRVKWDPADISRIHIYDERHGRYIEVLANDQEYTRDLSVWKHRVIKAEAAKLEDKEDKLALAEVKRDLSRQISDSRRRARGRKNPGTRARDTRYETGGASTRDSAAWSGEDDNPKAVPKPTGGAEPAKRAKPAKPKGEVAAGGEPRSKRSKKEGEETTAQAPRGETTAAADVPEIDLDAETGEGFGVSFDLPRSRTGG